MNRLQLPVMTLVWLLRRCAWYIGWIPMLLSVLLLTAWCLLQQQHEAQRAELASLRQEIRQLAVPAVTHTPPASAVVEPASHADNAPAQVALLWQQLPAFSDLSPRMMQIAKLAQKRQILLNVGDYQWQSHQSASGNDDIQQFDMRFTIQADYLTCRQFVLDVLRQYPTMALTGLELRKNETLQPVIEATLTFSVFIRGGIPHAS